jgi:hypothetical protein
MSGEKLTARKLGALVPACENRRHVEHQGITCEQADEQIAHEEAFWKTFRARAYTSALRTPMADVPPALRGPNWKGTP